MPNLQRLVPTFLSNDIYSCSLADTLKLSKDLQCPSRTLVPVETVHESLTGLTYIFVVTTTKPSFQWSHHFWIFDFRHFWIHNWFRIIIPSKGAIISFHRQSLYFARFFQKITSLFVFHTFVSIFTDFLSTKIEFKLIKVIINEHTPHLNWQKIWN